MARLMLRIKVSMILIGLFCTLYLGLLPLSEWFERKDLVAAPEEIVFVNTSVCHVSGPRNPAAFCCAIEPINKLRCRMPQLLTAVTQDGSNFLEANKISEDLNCRYWLKSRYTRIHSGRYTTDGRFDLKSGANRKIKIGTGEQIVRIRCSDKFNETKYHDVHYFLPPPDRKLKPTESPEKLSVMVLGIDSVSHMHFVRYFPLVQSFLENHPHTMFLGYSRVGLDANANLVPFLGGKSRRVAVSDFLSDEKFSLWEGFKMQGYSTAYGEDNAKGILSGRNGDEELPKNKVDFDLTPVLVEMDNHTRYSIDLKERIHCTAGRKFQEVLRHFILQLVPYMQGMLFFSFFWQSQGVEEYYEYASHLDLSYMMLLKKLVDADILNNTLLFLMSDHGLRAGEYRMSLQGMKEESQPLMVAIYPEWLKRKYPLAVGNLEGNAHSLITPYDLRETLADVLVLGQLKNANIEVGMKRLQSQPAHKLPRGISLFLPVPDHRTCELAHIPPLFCFCRELTEIPTDDGLVLRSSRFLVESINQLIKPFGQCRQLKLEMVLLAYFLDLGDESFVYELRLRVRTTPGSGVFEATVRLSDVLLLTSPISRVNHYLGQSHCVGDPGLKLFCLCV
ncbi:uncharacterized protein LOC6548360 [Drosophila erecta]|uniref:DUF229 domain-containing protein n=1 Tax=Drosophila erecta TaxID=7220 RepID=B3NKQ9_DROER|nr:uncharacterized protein LOC6548360 [Drosophila erecta]EDV54363.1 uncharacterized protein Dere_GG21349 [Drosophila erecta]